MKYIFHLSILFLFSLWSFDAQAQEESHQKKYPFLRTEKNEIQGDSLTWVQLGRKLDSLKYRQEVFNIVHIGDSHLQAGFLNGVVRTGLQKKYGNAGPGLLVPYKVGRTNEPGHVRTRSNMRWRARRIVSDKDTLAIGLSGITVQARQKNAEMQVSLISSPGLDYSITGLQVFSRHAAGEMPMSICDSARCFLAFADARQPEQIIRFEKPIHQFSLIPDSMSQDSIFTLYGMNGINDSAGIRYHTIAINGAEYRHYVQQELFLKQLEYLKPNLFILSLGTNEAFAAKFDTSSFRQQADSLIRQIRQQFPQAHLLITTPGDAMKGRKYKNPRNRLAGQSLIQLAQSRSCSTWDLFSIMGGYGSIQKWYSKGLTAKDKLHLNRRGYELQGQLLLEAILKKMHP